MRWSERNPAVVALVEAQAERLGFTLRRIDVGSWGLWSPGEDPDPLVCRPIFAGTFARIRARLDVVEHGPVYARRPGGPTLSGAGRRRRGE